MYPCSTTDVEEAECYAISNCTKTPFPAYVEVRERCRRDGRERLGTFRALACCFACLPHSTHVFLLPSSTQTNQHTRTRVAKVEVDCSRQSLTERNTTELDTFAERWKRAVDEDCALRVSVCTSPFVLR